MANRFPLIVNTTSGNSVQELPVGDFLDLSSSGISNSGNILVSGIISATGSVTGASVVGGVMTGTSLSVSGTVTAASTVGGVITGTSASVSGAVTGGSISVSTGNITGGNLILSGAIEDSAQLDIRTTASNANIVFTPNGTGNVNTGANVSVTGRVTAASVVGGVITGTSTSVTGAQTAASTVGGVITGSSTSVSGTVTAASTVGGVITGSSVSVTGTVTGASLAGTITTAAQTNITSVGTLGSLSVTANVQAGNVRTVGQVSATGNISGNFFVGNGSQLTGISVGSNSISNGTSNVVVAAGGNISVAVAGTAVLSFTTAGIINNQANGVGNIGNATGYFNTIFAKATSAQYADLAEMYVSDESYSPGTVVEFGGSAEITISSSDHSTQVAGVISTNPSYLMNATQVGDNVLAVALVGRVPCLVTGNIVKGDRLVASALPGVATRLDPIKYQPACIIGKALEDFNSGGIGCIEIAVGRT
jgi:hypothetical protein